MKEGKYNLKDSINSTKYKFFIKDLKLWNLLLKLDRETEKSRDQPKCISAS